MFNKIEMHGNNGNYPHREKICHYKQISVNESLSLPCVKPEIEQLLEVLAQPFVDECAFIDTPVGKKLIIKGHIDQTVVYVADIPCQPVHAAHFTMPFCSFEEVPSSCTLSHCDMNHPHVVMEYLCAQQTGPKEISKCIVLFVWWPKKEHHPCPHPPCPPPEPPHPCPPVSTCSTAVPGPEQQLVTPDHYQESANHSANMATGKGLQSPCQNCKLYDSCYRAR